MDLTTICSVMSSFQVVNDTEYVFFFQFIYSGYTKSVKLLLEIVESFVLVSSRQFFS